MEFSTGVSREFSTEFSTESSTEFSTESGTEFSTEFSTGFSAEFKFSTELSLVSFWNRFLIAVDHLFIVCWIVAGSFVDGFGIILVLCWDRFGIVL